MYVCKLLVSNDKKEFTGNFGTVNSLKYKIID